MISKEGIRPDLAKTEKVQRFPTPVDATKVRQFLGLASYYRCFVPGFAQIAAPLHALTKKNATFHWTPECESAFSKLKQLLTTAPVLSYPCLDHSVSSSSKLTLVGWGLVLYLHKNKWMVRYTLLHTLLALLTPMKEIMVSRNWKLALVWAVRYFRPYLLGHHTTVYTDHAACRSLLDSARPSGKLARWALTIQEMDLTILYRSGKKNANADALSRNPASVFDAVDETTLVCSIVAEEDPLLK